MDGSRGLWIHKIKIDLPPDPGPVRIGRSARSPSVPGTVVFGVSTHSVPTVDHFFRVEWTAAFPLWTLNLAQRDTVHGARCALPPTGSSLYHLACTGTVPIQAHEFCGLH